MTESRLSAASLTQSGWDDDEIEAVAEVVLENKLQD